MTGNELKILQDWQDERHREMMARFDSLDEWREKVDERMERIEDTPRLTPVEVIQIRQAALNVSRAVRLFSAKKAAAVFALPSMGGVLYFLQWVRNVVS
jgi:hypothetical protein